MFPGWAKGWLRSSAAGVTTVEALADMTPEQLEAIEGIGPKTVEKISLAVNNYFASLEAGVAEGEVRPRVVTAEGEAVTRGGCRRKLTRIELRLQAKSPRKKLKRQRLRHRRKPKRPRSETRRAWAERWLRSRNN